ncbi:hypothetical protein Clacol_002302 [Clathrus columnatus]|uniref:Uncharacterized protein n=1 Tax=Clathrus columnatus TaxID=1419009 RepID=A0AAV5A5R3_9AGAM|nr:hypothetical protein Clacol_002302 [Clathrus columnatus]
MDELLRRSGSAELDVALPYDSNPLTPKFKKLFAKESNRIRNLVVDLNSFDCVISAKHFTSLRGLSLLNRYSHHSRLLSLLVASDHLETLELKTCENIQIPQKKIALIFGRIRSLKLTVLTVDSFVHAVLNSSVKLERLRLETTDGPMDTEDEGTEAEEIEAVGPVILLPKLRFLSITYPAVLNYLHAPKLDSLDVEWEFRVLGSRSFNWQIFKEFDFLSIKYLYTWSLGDCYEFYILGSKQPIHHTYFFPYSGPMISKLEFLVEDSSREYSRNCFRLSFEYEHIFATALTSVLSRSKNLTELHLLHNTIDFQPPVIIPLDFPELQLLSIEDSSPLLEYLRAPKLSSLLSIEDSEWTPKTIT